MSFPVADRIVNYIVLRILDDDVRIVNFNGGSWSITLEIDVEEGRVFKIPGNFRDMLTDRTDRTSHGRSGRSTARRG